MHIFLVPPHGDNAGWVVYLIARKSTGNLIFSLLQQVFVTQVYSGTGSAEHLSAFLIPQYILMLPSMTALTAYTLQTLF
jgi:hypothetical protein